MHDLLTSLPLLGPGRSRRASSWDRTGGNADSVRIPKGTTAVLADLPGSGVVRHIWVTVACKDPLYLRHLILRMHWDGEAHPSVESPLGDFFGQGWGEHYLLNSLPFAAAPAGGKAMSCFLPMPFGRGARITVENQSAEDVASFYFYVDWEEMPVPGEMGRLHAWWHRELTAPPKTGENEWLTLGQPPASNLSDRDNYLFVEAKGRGHFAGVHYYVDCPTPIWYGEGDDMFVIDDEPWPPSLHGTGTEDYFCTAWCPKEAFQHPLFGIARAANPRDWLGRTHLYRWHLADPIRFRTSLRASIEHGHANLLTLDLASVAFWYQSEPHAPFPALPGPEGRLPMPEVSATDLHRWRHAWREARGGGTLWGGEDRPS